MTPLPDRIQKRLDGHRSKAEGKIAELEAEKAHLAELKRGKFEEAAMLDAPTKKTPQFRAAAKRVNFPTLGNLSKREREKYSSMFGESPESAMPFIHDFRIEAEMTPIESRAWKRTPEYRRYAKAMAEAKALDDRHEGMEDKIAAAHTKALEGAIQIVDPVIHGRIFGKLPRLTLRDRAMLLPAMQRLEDSIPPKNPLFIKTVLLRGPAKAKARSRDSLYLSRISSATEKVKEKWGLRALPFDWLLLPPAPLGKRLDYRLRAGEDVSGLLRRHDAVLSARKVVEITSLGKTLKETEEGTSIKQNPEKRKLDLLRAARSGSKLGRASNRRLRERERGKL